MGRFLNHGPNVHTTGKKASPSLSHLNKFLGRVEALHAKNCSSFVSRFTSHSRTTMPFAPSRDATMSVLTRLFIHLRTNFFYVLIFTRIQELQHNQQSAIISTLLWFLFPIISILYFVLKWTILINLEAIRFIYNLCVYLFVGIITDSNDSNETDNNNNNSSILPFALNAFHFPRLRHNKNNKNEMNENENELEESVSMRGFAEDSYESVRSRSNSLNSSHDCSHDSSYSISSFEGDIAASNEINTNHSNNTNDNTNNNDDDAARKKKRIVSQSVRIYNPWLQRRKRCQIATEMSQIEMISLGGAANGTMGGKAFEQYNFSSGELILKPNGSKPNETSIVTEVRMNYAFFFFLCFLSSVLAWLVFQQQKVGCV